ncbi:hypothetical protein Ahy_B08g093931 isoform C [Arachis hypogaea]|uniref:Uncharacterized protein n=1 Tax=Arachis hypogaea TaxID=3818 RepID=A0A444Y7D6_ARAHY|nr:hypothetical protein Ahy_B08g093931 isoform C [Arachis hypogaea]
MPASFKVRTILLDGGDAATEDVLDPDFGEAAIGRVAHLHQLILVANLTDYALYCCEHMENALETYPCKRELMCKLELR